MHGRTARIAALGRSAASDRALARPDTPRSPPSRHTSPGPSRRRMAIIDAHLEETGHGLPVPPATIDP